MSGKRGPILCYWSPVCIDLTKEWHGINAYEGGLRQVAAETFRKWGNELLEKIFVQHEADRKVRIVSALFCLMRYFNDKMYFPGETTPNDER